MKQFLMLYRSYIQLLEQPSVGEHTLRFTFTFGEDPVSGETIEPIVSEVTFTHKVEEEE